METSLELDVVNKLHLKTDSHGNKGIELDVVNVSRNKY